MKNATKKTGKGKQPVKFDLSLNANRKLTKKEEAHLKKAFRVFAEGAALALDVKPIIATYNSNPGG
jgi:hypothetical protein